MTTQINIQDYNQIINNLAKVEKAAASYKAAQKLLSDIQAKQYEMMTNGENFRILDDDFLAAFDKQKAEKRSYNRIIKNFMSQYDCEPYNNEANYYNITYTDSRYNSIRRYITNELEVVFE